MGSIPSNITPGTPVADGDPFEASALAASLTVASLPASLAWYRDVLGFELVYELKEYGWCELQTPFGFNIGLGQTETVAQGNITPTFGVRDIDAAIAELRAQDVKVEDWHEIPKMVRLSTFYDPDGTPWMLAQTLVSKEEFVPG